MRASSRNETAAARRSGFSGRQAPVLCLALAATLSITSPAISQNQLQNAAKQRLEQNQQRLKEAEQREKQLKADLAAIEAERARLNEQLQAAAQSVQLSEAQLTTIEARRDALLEKQKQHQEALQKRHSSISNLLAAVQRMGRNPPPVIITRREDALEMVRSAMLLGRAIPSLQSEVQDLVARLQELDAVLKQIAEERQKIEEETQRLKAAQTRLAMLMEEKKHSLSERQSQLEEVRREAERISKSVNDIGELISALDQTVAEKTGLGTYQNQLAKEKAQQKQDETEVAVVLAPEGPLAGPPGRMKPAIPFHLAKGKLPLPAQGRIAVSFGETTSNGRKSQGIVIQTRHGAQVTSPTDGWVVYAGEFRSYRQLLIINAGGGYHVLLAGLSHIDVQVGQFLLAGEPVGTMSVTPGGQSTDNAPVLYVEFRKEGRPIDPAPWWYQGQQIRVQG